jgi:mannose-6-phosphate isomerase-like protein (cupin superfamily)
MARTLRTGGSIRAGLRSGATARLAGALLGPVLLATVLPVAARADLAVADFRGPLVPIGADVAAAEGGLWRGTTRGMADFTKLNLRDDVEDMARKHGMPDALQARYARQALELQNSGLTLFGLGPNFRVPFGHKHGVQEEVYVVVSGSARFKIGDKIVEAREWDAVRVPPESPRGMEAGPDGAEILAIGAPRTDQQDAEMVSDFWPPGSSR